MPSLIEQAQGIRNETQRGSITPERVGQFMEESAKVTETVDTIADLRQFDTRQLSNGDYIKVNSHNSNGLSKGYGSGIFKWVTTPIFSLSSFFDASVFASGGIAVFETTPLAKGVPATELNNTATSGAEIVFENGTTTYIARVLSTSDDGTRSFGKGETSITVKNPDVDIPSGTKAYFADDNGIHIRPIYTGFDGEGVWERVNNTGFVTPEMFGAVPSDSPNDVTPYDSLNSLQDAYDSFYDVLLPNGYYYISNTLLVRRNKTFTNQGSWNSFAGPSVQRRVRYTDSPTAGVIYTDQNIDLVEIQAPCNYKGYADCSLIPAHNKIAFKFNVNFNIKGDFDFFVVGNEETLTDTADTGTRAVILDGTVRESTDSNNLAYGGYMYTSNIKLNVYNCHTGIGYPPLADTSLSSTNSLNVDIYGRGVKRLIYFETGCGTSTFEGWYQDSEVLQEGNEATPLIEFEGDQSASYINIFGFDMSGSTTPQRHSVLLNLNNTGYMELGPRMLWESMYNKVTDNTKELISNCNRIDKLDFNTDALLRIPKRVVKTVTAAEISTAGDTRIVFLEDVEGGVVVQNVMLRNFTGSSEYTTNDNLNLMANSNGSYIVCTIDLSSLTLPLGWNYAASINRPDAQFTSIGSNNTRTLWLTAPDGNPSGGDIGFDIVIDYYEAEG